MVHETVGQKFKKEKRKQISTLICNIKFWVLRCQILHENVYLHGSLSLLSPAANRILFNFKNIEVKVLKFK